MTEPDQTAVARCRTGSWTADATQPPAVFCDLALARRLERAEARANASFVEARAKCFPESGAGWIEVAGAYAMFDTPASPVSQTFGLGLFRDVTAGDLEQIERFFLQRSAPVFHEVSPLASPALFALLNQRQYQPVEFTSVMFRPIRAELSLAAPVNERIRVRLARDGEEDLWARIAAKGWSHMPELTDFILEMGRFHALRADGLSFLAEVEGEPIAAAALCLSDGVALLAGACTIPERRKQGAQLALLQARLRYAAEHGGDIAMMCAAPGSGSQRNAERHGFRIAYTRIKWGRGRVEALKRAAVTM